VSRPTTSLLLWLLPVVGALAACARDGEEKTAKSPSLACTADADCAVTVPFSGCCPGCGAAPEEHVALPVKEVERRRAKEARTCERRRDCPLINCPVLRFCNETKAVCADGRCALRLVPIPDCTELRYDRPAAMTPP